MSRDPEPPLSPEPIGEALNAISRADKAVADLCAGRLRWEMRVPAEPDHDPDLIISDALGKARRLIAALPVGDDAPSLDVERLYQAILDELVVLWGEPSDAVSVQVRPIVARSIADRYDRLAPR